MSGRMPWWQIAKACWKLPLPATQKLVLAAIAGHVNDDGNAKLLVGTLVDLTGLRRSTVQAALRALERRQPPILESLQRPGRSSLYQINVAALPQLDLFAEAKRTAAFPVKTRPSAGPARHAGHPSGGHGSPQSGPPCPPGGPITPPEPSTNRRGPTGPRRAGDLVADSLRISEVERLVKMMGRPATLKRGAGESLEDWDARVRAAWKAENDNAQRTAAGG